MKTMDEIYKEMSEDEYYIKREIEYYEDKGRKNALNEMSDIISKMMTIKGNYGESENDYYIERGRKKALKEIQNTISEMKEMVGRKFMKETAKYWVDDELIEKGYLYDDFHLYVPFTYKNDENPDPEIYLAISVWARYNWGDGDIPEVFYWWCQRVGDKFKILGEYWVGLFPINENYDFINDLYQYGDECGLTYDEGQYREFAKRLKDDIFSSPSLDYLKNVESYGGRSTSEELNLGLGFI